MIYILIFAFIIVAGGWGWAVVDDVLNTMHAPDCRCSQCLADRGDP